MVTQERLKAVLSYEPETGIFRWLVNAGRQRAGQVAGGKRETGHIVIRIDGRLYRAHQLAFLFTTGEWPKGVPDHIYGIKDDNRFSQLRDATPAINSQNQRLRRPLMGVEFRPGLPSPYRVRIRVNGKNQTVGSFADPEVAAAAYLEAKRALHPGCTI